MSNVKLKIAVSALTTLLLFWGIMVHQAVAQVAGRVVVAKSGGDYTSISAALAAISPTSANPYVIDVMPGTYVENVVIPGNYSYLHLRGAGHAVTIIQSSSPSSDVVAIAPNGGQPTNITISGFTIKGGSRGLLDFSMGSTITANAFSGNVFAMQLYSNGTLVTGNIIDVESYGINVPSSSGQITISGNTITVRSGGFGIFFGGLAEIAINNNTIRLNPFSTEVNAIGIRASQSSGFSNRNAVIQGNTFLNLSTGIDANGFNGNIIGNTFNNKKGLVLSNSSQARVIGNNFLEGQFGYEDIVIDATSTSNVSHNIYDILVGNTGVGLYNVKSDGSPAPNP
ncbi:MAG: pectinesterase family protein [Candidatus Manganitrophaceae bacterium]